MSEINTGTLLAGKYRLESLLGRGGMGSVWRAEHLALNAPVAVKLIDMIQLGATTEALARFHREARAAAAIRSPHVVQIFDHGVDEALGVPFIVMELMEGESLAQRIARCGRISPAEAARVFTHVARALSRAHDAGIVHRDLKPDNVFLVRNEDDEVAKVLDFGIAKAQAHGINHESGTRTGAVMGTAYYMSPEQISGAKGIDFRTDLWAFGVMACECLTGKRPFEAESIGGMTLKICIEPVPLPSSFAAVPAGFDAWFAKIVNRDPAQRFSSAREAADTLRQVCTGEVGAERLTSLLPEPQGVVHAATSTTAAPLSRSADEFLVAGLPKKWKGPAPWLAGGAVATALAGVLWLGTAGKPEVVDDAKPSASAPVVAAATAPTELAPNSTASSASRDPEPVVSPVTLASAAPSALAAPTVGRAPRPLRVTPPRQVKPDCDPNFTFDNQGRKHFKPKCFGKGPP